MLQKKFNISSSQRVYLSGVSLAEQDIKNIHILEERIRQQYKCLTDSEICKKICQETKLDKRTVKKYMNENSSIKVGGKRKKHNTEVLSFIQEYVKQNPETYLREIQKALENEKNLKIGLSSIFKYMKEDLGFSHKKVVKHAYYRCLPRVQQLRANFRELVKRKHPWSYVFVDESHFDSKTFEVFSFLFNLETLWIWTKK
jgi:transposase